MITVAQLARDGHHCLQPADASVVLRDQIDLCHPDPLVIVDLDGARPRDIEVATGVLDAARPAARALLVGLATEAPAPHVEPLLARLMTTLCSAPNLQCAGNPDNLSALSKLVAGAPRAALVLADLLELTASSSLRWGVTAESFAYSMLLAGPEFAQWRAATPIRSLAEATTPVLMSRDGTRLHLRLNRPERRNAFGRSLRNALLDGLAIARIDASVTDVLIDGAGPAFCSGGDLDEFGTTPDPVTAHHVRMVGHAGLAVHELRDKARFRVHGACIGAGIEIPAFAVHIEASSDASFALPELGLGLVPGAGGTVSIPARIGRWRTAYLALTGAKIDAATALNWGLVDAVV
ncbi:hypothetical protein J2S59_000564 [Nocardioides massiliensis]|uniref:Enoyl-CoA hydratase/isomerase family protein n=1 Tax=Nocardioides massiliensis TaxID=1325935 RepID=A0ABT9NL47_9ACTN|nr:enoyl-CoA hydratase/isomerase family protein [Nocardioides massiliensis]MDP9820755.1 hypothetical protein [Nocardioides massiliensis]